MIQPGYMLGFFIAFPIILALLCQALPIPRTPVQVTITAIVAVVSIPLYRRDPGWSIVITVPCLVYVYLVTGGLGVSLPSHTFSVAIPANILLLLVLMIRDVRRGATRDWVHWVGTGSFLCMWSHLTVLVLKFVWFKR